MNKWITRQNIAYKLQQLLILILHLVLLKWIMFALKESGSLKTSEVFLHFTGMAVYGGLLIRGCAWWAKRRYLKESGRTSLN